MMNPLLKKNSLQKDPLICLIIFKLLETYLHRWFSKEQVNYVKLFGSVEIVGSNWKLYFEV